MDEWMSFDSSIDTVLVQRCIGTIASSTETATMRTDCRDLVSSLGHRIRPEVLSEVDGKERGDG